jgi:ribosomal protein L11 methyltransferase
MCCNWLNKVISDKKLNNQQPAPTVLDYGCGSAILGLAALKYGAHSASGVDIDIESLESARRNCQANNLYMDLYMTSDNDSPESWPISVTGIDLETSSHKKIKELTKQFDITVANILAPILISLVEELASKTKPNGLVALSGLVLKQSEDVIKYYQKYFDDVTIEASEDDWVLITGIRNNNLCK